MTVALALALLLLFVPQKTLLPPQPGKRRRASTGSIRMTTRGISPFDTCRQLTQLVILVLIFFSSPLLRHLLWDVGGGLQSAMSTATTTTIINTLRSHVLFFARCTLRCAGGLGCQDRCRAEARARSDIRILAYKIILVVRVVD